MSQIVEKMALAMLKNLSKNEPRRR